MPALAPTLLALATLTAGQAEPVVEPAAEPVVELQLLDNPRFEAPAAGPVAADGVAPIPWWRTTGGRSQLVERGADGPALATQGAYRAAQPVAAYAPLAGRIRLRATVGGAARLSILDGRGDRAVLEVEAGTAPGSWKVLTVDDLGSLAQLAAELPGTRGFERPDAPLPRLLVTLESAREDAPAFWRSVELFVLLPCPDEGALRAELLAELRWILDLWLARGLDRDGPRETGFLAWRHDAVTGARTTAMPGGPNVLFELLRDALEVEPVPEWRAAYERFLDDWLELGFHPETGLPCGWDCARDVRVDDSPREVHATLGLLIDVAERGPQRFRERARARALSIAAHVAARGALPDGTVAPGYWPADGRPHLDYPPLRRLDVPAQLARASTLPGADSARWVDVAREAVLALEFTHAWPGTWDAIDPGWDDQYGHYGARAAVMEAACPEVEAFSRLALGGYRHYAPIWRDALRLGGNVAADQVRCWEILRELGRRHPAERERIAELLRAAVRSHFKGEQYGDGAWGDVTVYRFDPRDNLQVGDLPGTPQNLLHGLALCYDPALGLRGDELRGMFTAVMRSTRDHYRRDHGYLSTRRERAGANAGGGSLRFAVGLVEMLRQLSPEDERR